MIVCTHNDDASPLCYTSTGPFQWGRIPAYFLVTKEVTNRLFAQPGAKGYSKLSVLFQALSDGKVVATFPRNMFDPVHEKRQDSYTDDEAMQLLHFTPKVSNGLQGWDGPQVLAALLHWHFYWPA